jgi:hypothetical protein
LTRVNSANILDEGLRIGGRRRQMNSKVKIQTNKAKLDACWEYASKQLAQSRSVPGRPLLAPIYRCPGLEDLVGFNTNYTICIISYIDYNYNRA